VSAKIETAILFTGKCSTIVVSMVTRRLHEKLTQWPPKVAQNVAKYIFSQIQYLTFSMKKEPKILNNLPNVQNAP
jgi:hypothetical protein